MAWPSHHLSFLFTGGLAKVQHCHTLAFGAMGGRRREKNLSNPGHCITGYTYGSTIYGYAAIKWHGKVRMPPTCVAGKHLHGKKSTCMCLNIDIKASHMEDIPTMWQMVICSRPMVVYPYSRTRRLVWKMLPRSG